MPVPYDDAVMQALAVLAAARTTTAQAAIVEAMAARLVDAVAGRQDADAAPSGIVRCEHPEEQRADAGTLRAPSRYFCRLCREFVNPAASAADQT